MECCKSDKVTARDAEQKRMLINRLSRIEGQIRGIKAMIEEDRYCIDILTQSAAASSALSAFSSALLESHIRTCVTEGIRAGDTERVEELIQTIGRFMK